MRALIVTLARTRGSLTAVRALDRAGWTVGVGTPSGEGMVTASRHCTLAHEVPRPRGDGAAFVAGVRRAVAEGGYDVVFGGADDWMAALATYRAAIPTTVAHPAGDVIDAALDKVGLTERAAVAGFDVPRTVVATDEEIRRWVGPVVVKCRTHWFPGQEHRTRVEARRFDTIAAAAERIAAIRRAGFEPVLQAPVEGELSALVGLFHDGRLLGRVQQRTSRLWPTPSGVSTRAVTVPVDEDLAERATRLLKDLGWHGLVELQLLTGRDGRPHLIDLNGRFYGSLALAVAAGPNLPDAWGRLALGQPPPDLSDGRPGVRYAWMAGDLRRAWVERRGNLVRDLLDSWRWSRTATASVWDRSDLGPVRDLLNHRIRRVVRDGS